MRMLVFTCPSCMHIFQAKVSQGKAIYMLKNRRIMLLSDEQECDDCIKRLERAVKDEKKAIQQETILG